MHASMCVYLYASIHVCMHAFMYCICACISVYTCNYLGIMTILNNYIVGLYYLQRISQSKAK